MALEKFSKLSFHNKRATAGGMTEIPIFFLKSRVIFRLTKKSPTGPNWSRYAPERGLIMHHLHHVKLTVEL